VGDRGASREAGADFIVVGRPIYQSADPRGICERILGQI